MTIHRVALIFDNRRRPETTGGYCLRALSGLVEVEHFLPDAIPNISPEGFDLFLHVDDGMTYVLPPKLRPSVWWAIDTHLDFDGCLHKAHAYDLIFAAQKNGTFELCDAGISTHWLPLACDPEVHRPYPLAKEFDVAFVGHVFPGPRSELLELIQRRFPSTFVGQRFFDAMAKVYSTARIVFNRSIRDDLNMRVFEALGCGSLLVTNDLRCNGQAELFADGTHCAVYSCAEELIDKLAFYLSHEELRERIAARGRAEVVARHTYRHRMEVLLQTSERLLNAAVSTAISVSREDIAPACFSSSSKFTDSVVECRPVQSAPQRTWMTDMGYFEFSRPEILQRIPLSAQKVLDIGCGSGRLGASIKARQPATVIGVEVTEAAAHRAQANLDAVYVGDIEQLDIQLEPRTIDVVICGDVLEHLRNPSRLLRRAREWLRPDGRLIASIPNVRHHSVLRSLLDGNWTYETAGLLDRTHLQFFTRRDIEELFASAGFVVERWDMIPGPGHAEWVQAGRPNELNVGRLRGLRPSPDEVEEFYVYQFLVTAQPKESTGSASSSPLARADPAPSSLVQSVAHSVGHLRILYVGDFSSSWRHESQAAWALEEIGHEVERLQEDLMPSVAEVQAILDGGRFDCLLFYKGRIGARTVAERFHPTGELIAKVLRKTRVPGFVWYVDRAYQFDFDPSREAWMKLVAPLCRVAFVADGPLLQTNWAKWHVLREPISSAFVQKVHAVESERADIAFIGQIYGNRATELTAVMDEFSLEMISGVYGAALSREIQRFRIILGPRYPCVPGYWGNRVCVVLGHGGFFLAPEVDGMRDDGFVPGVHFAPLGDHPISDIRYWLGRPAERAKIALAGQALVLERHTYRRAVQEMCRVITESLG